MLNHFCVNNSKSSLLFLINDIMGKFWFIFMIACHGIGHKPQARRLCLTCVTTSSKPNNDRIWEIVSEISWTERLLSRCWPVWSPTQCTKKVQYIFHLFLSFLSKCIWRSFFSKIIFNIIVDKKSKIGGWPQDYLVHP